ncbi:MAG: ribonuclease P protein component [Ferruginibacter sp.]|nr:ribonuclease P protein component [Ferruginibacter sp.]
MDTTQRYCFKKNEKLKSRKAIEHLFKSGNQFSNFPFKILWLFNETTPSSLQTGFAVSSKHFKKAVDRNRVKRLMREAYRLQKNELKNQLIKNNKQLSVFFIYVGNELPKYDFIFEKTGNVLKRLLKILNDQQLNENN